MWQKVIPSTQTSPQSSQTQSQTGRSNLHNSSENLPGPLQGCNLPRLKNSVYNCSWGIILNFFPHGDKMPPEKPQGQIYYFAKYQTKQAILLFSGKASCGFSCCHHQPVFTRSSTCLSLPHCPNAALHLLSVCCEHRAAL